MVTAQHALLFPQQFCAKPQRFVGVTSLGGPIRDSARVMIASG